MLKQTALLTAAAIAVTACATGPYGAPPPGGDPYNQGAGVQGRVGTRTATGAIAGGLVGGALGYLTNTNKSEEGRTNALIGAGIGALAGAGVGRYMDQQAARLQQQTAGTGVEVIRQGDNIILQMPGDVTFAYDRADIQPQFYGVLDNVAQTLAQFPATYVDVVGHADATGSDEYNLGLSQRRASSVAGYLVSRNVLADRLFVAGQGERSPRASNATEQGRAQNRRVEIVLRPHTAQG
ncbi:MAG: OmpA family protein [Proteobacteria bacterium]|nr:OmpA family protein [Pseudomonadota bacterium]